MCGICVENWPLSAVFLGVLAQAGTDIFDLCGVFHHGVLGGAQHILAVVGHGLTQRARLTLGSGGDVRQDSQVLTVNRGSGKQEVVVTRRLYPTYQGAVVVCQGAGDSRVRLRVLETVSVLTGLSSDKISVVQWKQ